MKPYNTFMRALAIAMLVVLATLPVTAQYVSRSQVPSRFSRRTTQYDVADIRVPEPGRLEDELGKQFETVRLLRVSGTLNRDDIRFLNKLCKRSKVVDSEGRKVDNYIDLDLEMVRLEIKSLFGRSRSYEIESDAFSYCSRLRSIVLPDRINTIGRRAFHDCYDLEDVIMPPSVTAIEESAFEGCGNLAQIDLPRSIESIGNKAFKGCRQMRTIYLNNGLAELGAEALADVPITRIEIPRSLRNIGKKAFDRTKLRTVAIPADTQIEGNDLGYMPQLTEYVIEEGHPTLRSYAGLLYNTDMTTLISCPPALSGTIDVPDGVTIIADEAFYGCSSLSIVSLPESLSGIGQNAFKECSALRSINLPEFIQNIGNGAFKDCRSLTSIVLPTGISLVGAQTFEDCKSLQQVEFSESITVIGESAFKKSGLNQLKLPSSLEKISKEAFRDCNNLTSVTIPDATRFILTEAFRGCKNVQYLELGSGVTTIGDNAFRDMPITTLTLPPSVTTIGKKIVEKCKNLTRIECHAVNPPTLEKSSNEKIPLFVPGGSVAAYKTTKNWKGFKQINALP
ncbi:MAG: leucine-rich repeat domain-containing protein [Muribaculaceae bacterium]|nr:leucine-rich repeat domain-containing protein [Muribaculaceae bacterium]